jgi:tetratricopeptide (TPR) repeat protein
LIPIPAPLTSLAEIPAAPVAPVVDPVHGLLKDGEAAFNSGDNERARSSFENVLAAHDAGNGAALYGLGLIASREGNGERAREYFERAVASDSAEPGMKMWAYIYLGRMRDLDCERTSAVEYYGKALQIGDDTRNALSVAREGINAPWGGACR